MIQGIIAPPIKGRGETVLLNIIILRQRAREHVWGGTVLLNLAQFEFEVNRSVKIVILRQRAPGTLSIRAPPAFGTTIFLE